MRQARTRPLPLPVPREPMVPPPETKYCPAEDCVKIIPETADYCWKHTP